MGVSLVGSTQPASSLAVAGRQIALPSKTVCPWTKQRTVSSPPSLGALMIGRQLVIASKLYTPSNIVRLGCQSIRLKIFLGHFAPFRHQPATFAVGTRVSSRHRVTGGGRPPPVPTERSVRIYRTTLFGSWFTALLIPAA